MHTCAQVCLHGCHTSVLGVAPCEPSQPSGWHVDGPAGEWVQGTPAPHAHSQAVPQLLRVTWRPQGLEALLQEGHCREKGAGVRGSGAPPRGPHPPGCAQPASAQGRGCRGPTAGPQGSPLPSCPETGPRPEWGSGALGSCPTGPRPGSGAGGGFSPRPGQHPLTWESSVFRANGSPHPRGCREPGPPRVHAPVSRGSGGQALASWAAALALTPSLGDL